MRVLTFITSLSYACGGPARSVPVLAKGVAEVGVDIHLVTILSDDMNIGIVDGTSVKLHLLDRKRITEETIDIIDKEQIELIQIQSIWAPEYHSIAKIARKRGIPYIITPRGMLEPWSLQQKMWKKRLAMAIYQRRDLNEAACIYTTAYMEARHVRELGIHVPCSIIPNGIEIDDYPCRTSMDGVRKRVLFLSRIHEKKGIELLIDVWNRICQDFPDWRVDIVGNGEEAYIGSLKEKIKKLDLANSVAILPPAYGKDKVALYQSSSLFVLPSYSENFGMVIAEAMSCGLPVLTTTNCPWTILNETKTGWCIDLSLENLEKSMRLALSMNSKALYDMGQRASILVDNEYNYRNVAKRAKRLYEWIITGGEKPEFVI